MNKASPPTTKDIETMLKAEGQRKRDMGEHIFNQSGPCGIAKGVWPGICGRTGKAAINSDGTTRFIVYRCEEHA